MRVAWLSDLHLNFVRDARGECESEYDDLCRQVAGAAADAVLISGDIDEAPGITRCLDRLAADFAPLPLYFVLGNHDFYRGSIDLVRSSVREHCRGREQLKFLTFATAPIPLTSQTALVGHDGWADGRLGRFDRTQVRLNDFEFIQELMHLTKSQQLAQLNRLGDEAAEHLQRQLDLALSTAASALVLTHVPPFWDACRHRDQVSSPDWVPFFACEAVGNVLIDVALRHPDRQITVLCGHTHTAAKYQPKPNLLVLAAEAEYGSPALQHVLELS